MSLTILTLPPIIVAFVEIIKRALNMDETARERFLPLLNVVVGLLLGYFFLDGVLKELLLQGALAGLSAGGFYDLIKNPVKTVTKMLQ